MERSGIGLLRFKILAIIKIIKNILVETVCPLVESNITERYEGGDTP